MASVVYWLASVYRPSEPPSAPPPPPPQIAASAKGLVHAGVYRVLFAVPKEVERHGRSSGGLGGGVPAARAGEIGPNPPKSGVNKGLTAAWGPTERELGGSGGGFAGDGRGEGARHQHGGLRRRRRNGQRTRGHGHEGDRGELGGPPLDPL
eukprot:1108445-Prorocentrum_minimum.AAC.1